MSEEFYRDIPPERLDPQTVEIFERQALTLDRLSAEYTDLSRLVQEESPMREKLLDLIEINKKVAENLRNDPSKSSEYIEQAIAELDAYLVKYRAELVPYTQTVEVLERAKRLMEDWRRKLN